LNKGAIAKLRCSLILNSVMQYLLRLIGLDSYNRRQVKRNLNPRLQLELGFEPKVPLIPSPVVTQATEIIPEPYYHVLKPYKVRPSDRKFRQRIKKERGCQCEICGTKAAAEELLIHHILEARIYPQFAREPLNVLVLCEPCHSGVTDAERFGTSTRMAFYSKLRKEIRERHLPFLERTLPASSAIITAFRAGNWLHWNDRAVRDLTR
jgi:5-methylcytosine-specific restriction endonuclease McrA